MSGPPIPVGPSIGLSGGGAMSLPCLIIVAVFAVSVVFATLAILCLAEAMLILSRRCRDSESLEHSRIRVPSSRVPHDTPVPRPVLDADG